MEGKFLLKSLVHEYQCLCVVRTENFTLEFNKQSDFYTA